MHAITRVRLTQQIRQLGGDLGLRVLDAKLADRIRHGAQSSGWAHAPLGRALPRFYPSIPRGVSYTAEELALEVLVRDIIVVIDQVLEHLEAPGRRDE